MFTTFKTPQDYFNAMSTAFSSLPKTQKDVNAAFEKLQAVFAAEAGNSTAMWKTFQKAATGNATANEIAAANKQAAELLKATQFATLIAIPGVLFALPAIVEAAKAYGIDLVPASVATQFNI